MSEKTPTAPNGAEDGGEQQGFTPPASQDELNRIIADRLARERAKFADYDDLKAKADQLQALEDAQKTEAQAKTRAKELADTFDEVTGAATESTEALINQRLLMVGSMGLAGCCCGGR